MKVELETYIEDIYKAYLLLKRETYYEHVDLFLREEIATFENQNINEVFKKLDDFLKSKNLDNEWFLEQNGRIDFRLLPKKISDSTEDNYKFITNLRTQDSYQITEVNYFFSAKIPIYLLSTLWSMIVGPTLDNELSKECYGNRLEITKGDQKEKNDYRLFKIYMHQYNQWRDNAIQSGLDALEKNTNVLLIALDFKQCYYRLSVNWQKIQEAINNNEKISDKKLALFLTKIIEIIHMKYYERTKDFIEQTHSHSTLPTPKIGIPVGLPSSKIIANWELMRFDTNILTELRPIFYGRYVDDVLIVLNNPDSKVISGGVTKILEEYFLKNKILLKENGKEVVKEIKEETENKDYKEVFYKANGYEELYVQNSKIILHYYDHEHSWAGLKEFREELRQKTSEFRFLPEDDQYKDLVDEAYDIHYDGSMYRFRSIIGISENVTKLSHFLYKQQLKYWLCNKVLPDKTIEEIFRFYRGKNIFDYCGLWERVFTLFIISKKYERFVQFSNDLVSTISRLSHKDIKVTEKLKADCTQYKRIAMSMAIGYLERKITRPKFSSQFISFLLKEFPENKSQIIDEVLIMDNSLPLLLRSALLLRHQNIFWPLLDYSKFSGNLTKMDWETLQDCSTELKLVDKKIEQSTRFIQLDDFLLHKTLTEILSLLHNETSNSINSIETVPLSLHYDKLFVENGQEYIGEKEIDHKRINQIINQNIIFSKSLNTDNHITTLHTVFPSSREKSKDLCLGIVNTKVSSKDIEASFHPRKKPNTNYERQIVLFNLINLGMKKPVCDLIIFPEVSIPFAWLPFMVTQSRRSNVGLIFGLEHVVLKNKSALNLVATILPYKDKNQFSNAYVSLRLKNHYSPKEKHELSTFDLKKPNFSPLYEKFSWRGAVFAVYNCFELTDIQHRGLFRSEIDLLVAVEYNSDVNYFSNIIESATRDIHCFSAQANSSDFGDSRVISPSETESMNLIRVKGGDNSVLLKTILKIDELRDFQSRNYSPSHNEFKPTPAGYDHEKARQRK